MSKHTPTPWKATGRYVGTPRHMSYVAECSDKNGIWASDSHSTANAAFIVKAVNRDHLFDELVAVLKEIVSADPIDLALDPQWSQRIARIALAKAEATS